MHKKELSGARSGLFYPNLRVHIPPQLDPLALDPISLKTRLVFLPPLISTNVITPHYQLKMPVSSNQQRTLPQTQHSPSSIAATKGSNGSEAKSTNDSTRSPTNFDNSAFAMARFVAEDPRDSPWNNISMLPGMGGKSSRAKAA